MTQPAPSPIRIVRTALDRYARIGLRRLPKTHRSSRYAFNLLCLIGTCAAAVYCTLYIYLGLTPMFWTAAGIAQIVFLPYVAIFSERLAATLGMILVCAGFTILTYYAGRDSLLHLFMLLGLVNVGILRGIREPLDAVLGGAACTIFASICQVQFVTPVYADVFTGTFLDVFSTMTVIALGGMTIGVLLTLSYQIALAQDALAAEHARSEALLQNLLPDKIAARLKDHPGEVIADGLPAVTLLFADIVDFTPRAARQSPEAVVGFLNRIFSRFDTLSADRGLEKIKTIGDAYMVAAGLPLARDDHAEVIADMALAMQAEVARLSVEMGEEVALRIGIHSGPAIAGVIGTSKVFYDVWGDTVNTASRMESHGEPGRIQVTDATRVLLGQAYDFEDRGTIDIKGKGAVKTWWLVGKPA